MAWRSSAAPDGDGAGVREGGTGRGKLRLRALLLALAGCLAAPALAPAAAPAVCVSDEDDEDEDEEEKTATGVKFDLWGACAEVTATLTGSHQRELSKQPADFPTTFRRDGTPSGKSVLNTLTAGARLETARRTALGELKTAFDAQWSVDDDAAIGAASVNELTASLGGLTAGYTDSLMNFWSGDFSFQTTSPQRTVGLVAYEHAISETMKLSVAVESGLPTSRSAADGIQSVNFDAPLFTARWRYDTDDLELHLSGLVREAKFQSTAVLPFLATSSTRTGWAASFGATLPLPSLGEDDELGMQATWASDASPYLGTAQDLSSLSNTLRTTGPTVGWSVIASLHHVFTGQWKSNAFVSYLALDAELLAARPSVRTRRAGANLQFLPVEALTLTWELGYVETDLDPGGIAGFLTGTGGRALNGYFTVEWKF